MTELGRQPTYPRSDAAPEPTPNFDPLRYCIFTTIALLAWAAGPAAVTLMMSGLGLITYGRAWRRGLRQSRCVLGDVRLVLTYLGVAFIGGLVSTVKTLL